jgi:hypothetical protein
MASKLTTIGQVLDGGENIPRILVVSGKKENFWFLVNQISLKENGNVVINGVKINSNEPQQLDQDTKIFHVFVPGRS